MGALTPEWWGLMRCRCAPVNAMLQSLPPSQLVSSTSAHSAVLRMSLGGSHHFHLNLTSIGFQSGSKSNARSLPQQFPRRRERYTHTSIHGGLLMVGRPGARGTSMSAPFPVRWDASCSLGRGRNAWRMRWDAACFESLQLADDVSRAVLPLPCF